MAAVTNEKKNLNSQTEDVSEFIMLLKQMSDSDRIPIVTEIHDNGNGTVGWTTSSISVRGGMITAVPQGSANI